MMWLCYMGILKEGFSACSSPALLISRKLTKDKGVVTDFRHSNVRIAKNSLAYPLVREMFFCIRKFNSGYQRIQKVIVEYFHILVAHLNLPNNAHGIEYFPFYLQSYINVILDCLQSRKYCKAIMDNLLLFTPLKRSYMDKLEDLLRASLKNGLNISPRKCQLFRTNLNYMGNEIFMQNKRVCVQPLRRRLEAIQKLQPPTAVKGCKALQGW